MRSTKFVIVSNASRVYPGCELALRAWYVTRIFACCDFIYRDSYFWACFAAAAGAMNAWTSYMRSAVSIVMVPAAEVMAR